MWALTPISCLTHSWGRINPVHHAPSSLVELRLACFSAVPSRHDEWLLVMGILAGNGQPGPSPLPHRRLPSVLHGTLHSAWLCHIRNLGLVRDSPVVAGNGAEYISKLPDGSGSRLKKPGSGSGSAKKPVPSRSESEILETILAVRDQQKLNFFVSYAQLNYTHTRTYWIRICIKKQLDRDSQLCNPSDRISCYVFVSISSSARRVIADISE